MKAKIEFTLPDEQPEYDIHCQAPAMSSVLYEFSNTLRANDKYGAPPPKDWAEVRTLWWSLLTDYGLDPYGH